MGYTLEEIIDLQLFRDLQERINRIYHFPSAIIDREGKILTAVAWQEICSEFHRKHPECAEECRKCDQYINDHLESADPVVTYTCDHGLVDNAIPIIIDEVHYGSFFTGQYFLEEPDPEYFRKQATRFGFDEAAYLEALAKVPVWSEKEHELHLDLVRVISQVIISFGERSIHELESQRSTAAYEEQLISYMDNHPLTILNSVAMGFAAMTTEDRIDEFIPSKLKELCGAVACTFSIYDSHGRKTILKHIAMDNRLLTKAINLAGRSFQDFEYQVDMDMYKSMVSEIIGERKTLYEASFGAISRQLSSAVMKLAGIGRFIGLAYVVDEELYGTSIIAMGKGQPDVSREILENFVNMTASFLKRRKAEVELKSTEESLRQLHRRYIVRTEKENALISENLHYRVTQGIAGLMMEAGWLRKNFSGEDGILTKLMEMEDTLKSMSDEIQLVSTLLHPTMLNEIGLAAAVEWYGREFERKWGIPCSIHTEEIPELKEHHKLAFFRVLQEALSNIQQHASAKKVDISLQKTDHQAILKIMDYGNGMEKEKINSPASLGFVAMRERAKIAGGSVQVASRLKFGTTVSVSIPIDSHQQF